MAQDYLLFTNDKFKNFVLPPEVLQAFGMPETDGNGDPIIYTIERAAPYIKRGAREPMPIRITPGVGYEEVDASEATHWLCGVNNLTEKMSAAFKGLVEGEGADYLYVKLKRTQVIHLRDTGEIIP